MNKSALCFLIGAGFGLQPFAGCSDVGIVGGRCDQQQVEVDGRCLAECPEGLTACARTCVDLDDNEGHCGSCGNACSNAESCLEGQCVAAGTGGSTITGGAAGETSGGSAGETSGGSSGLPSGGSSSVPSGGSAGATSGGLAGAGGSVGQAGDGGFPDCEPPFNTPEQCGGCDVQCGGETPICGQVGAGYACVAECELPAEVCNGTCADPESDPDHCGQCGNACESGFCVDGECVGGTFGHVVLMCIDFEETARSSPIQWLLGNSVFLPAARLVRVLAFDGFTPGALRDNVDLTLSWAGGVMGEFYTLTHESNPEDVPDQLTNEDFDTFLVYAQTDAASGELATLGADWASHIDAFIDGGGTVVVLSGGQGEMGEFIDQAGLLEVSGETDATGVPLYNRTPTDAIGVNVLQPFKSRANTCRFTTGEEPSETLSYVITADPPTQPLDAPVVVHRILFGP